MRITYPQRAFKLETFCWFPFLSANFLQFFSQYFNRENDQEDTNSLCQSTINQSEIKLFFLWKMFLKVGREDSLCSMYKLYIFHNICFLNIFIVFGPGITWLVYQNKDNKLNHLIICFLLSEYVNFCKKSHYFRLFRWPHLLWVRPELSLEF